MCQSHQSLREGPGLPGEALDANQTPRHLNSLWNGTLNSFALRWMEVGGLLFDVSYLTCHSNIIFSELSLSSAGAELWKLAPNWNDVGSLETTPRMVCPAKHTKHRGEIAAAAPAFVAQNIELSTALLVEFFRHFAWRFDSRRMVSVRTSFAVDVVWRTGPGPALTKFD